LILDSEGEDDCASTILGGGSCACGTGEDGADTPSGDGGAFVGEEGSKELRGTVGDPDTRPRTRVKGEEAGVTDSLLARGEVCTAGGASDVAGAKG